MLKLILLVLASVLPLADLDSDDYSTRYHAQQTIRQRGIDAVPEIDEAFKTKLTSEQRHALRYIKLKLIANEEDNNIKLCLNGKPPKDMPGWQDFKKHVGDEPKLYAVIYRKHKGFIHRMDEEHFNITAKIIKNYWYAGEWEDVLLVAWMTKKTKDQNIKKVFDSKHGKMWVSCYCECDCCSGMMISYPEPIDKVIKRVTKEIQQIPPKKQI